MPAGHILSLSRSYDLQPSVSATEPRATAAEGAQSCRIAALYVHPIKSCAGMAVDQALLVETGLDLDRAWMVVDASGKMFTQRELPRMALVATQWRAGDLVLRAPGMLTLHVRVDTVEAATRVRVWDDIVKAYDMGNLAAQWFSDFLGRPLRLVRFDPDEKRFSSAEWTGDLQSENTFSDGFPLLVTSTASLAELNERLAARGQPAVTMQRFRPNLVLEDLQAFDEDHLDEITIATDDGPVLLRLVKPCVRCSIPNVDPVTAATSNEPGDTLTGFRADARLKGGITFGMNAIVVEGFDRTLRVGQQAQASWRF
ncbi:MAG: MOSC N-terminal beta barrel domain-containing protein [Chitinophagaceae bacterium]|nr:MOSC N-terminal beta barrel domain-containing protein [Rubrivivax sp.]